MGKRSSSVTKITRLRLVFVYADGYLFSKAPPTLAFNSSKEIEEEEEKGEDDDDDDDDHLL